jgi:hypothetical protein
VLYAFNGKAHLQGIYTGDIFINSDPSFVGQLIFLFIVETDSEDPFHTLTLEVTIPGNAPVSLNVPVLAPGPARGQNIVQMAAGSLISMAAGWAHPG